MYRIRYATLADRRWVYRWNTAPDVRAVSNCPRPINWAEHCAWYDRLLADPSIICCLAYTGQRRVGCVRVATTTRGGIVSVVVDPHFRRKGVGRFLVQAMEQEAALRHISRLVAEIHPQNTASRVLFATLGYRSTGSRSRWYHKSVKGIWHGCRE